MGSYVPNTKEQRQEMLKEIGFQTIDDLFAHIPAEVKIQGGLNIPEGKTELEVRRDMENIAAKNQVFKTIFRGAGAYRHFIPATVKSVISKENLLTAYTPYQAEISQGILQSVVMTLWAFLGLESACVNADAVENPERNVPIAVLGGTLGSAVIYILSTNVIFGMLPASQVAQSNAPFGLAFAYMFGPMAGKVVMALMCIACLGSLLGWQFTGGNLYRAAALKGFYPSIFASVNRYEAPVAGMVIAGLIQTGLSLMTISPTLNEQFEVLANLAVITNIIPYFFCMAAMELIMIKAGHGSREELRLPMMASFVGSLYTLYACYAAGMDAMMAATLVFFFGLTLYGFLAPSFEK